MTEKRGRPREYDGRIETAIRLPPELHARLKEAASDRMLPMNRRVVFAVAEFLDRLIPVDELKLTRD